ncbi:MAG: phenylacetic acid degradation protein PaaN [Gammaproteobacteria bacterium]|nr:phenylacetic acid degradation protein PaaN [Gammaproteobacteria bacterium]
MSELFLRHKPFLEKALDACEKRYAWTAYKESPSSKIHGKEIPAAAKKAFDEMLGKPLHMDLPGEHGRVGEEISPFTEEPLGVTYPRVDIDATFAAAREAQQRWRRLSVEDRVGVCLEMLDRLGQPAALFLNAHATVHTAGQSFIMAFAGCGANALDRGLEALAYAYKAMTDVPGEADWERRFGAAPEIHLRKRFRLVPRGTAVVVTCATFPQWNGYPAIMANLATGNPVVIKPHPKTTLPVALFVRTMREVLVENGMDPNLVTMVADKRDDPVTIELLHHPDTAIIDFTGGPKFGRWIEENCPNALVYTETAGCNSVVIESTDNFQGMCDAVAHSLCQASAQMCTSVQNIFVPRDGIDTERGHVSFDEVCDTLKGSVDNIIGNAGLAAFLCGTLVDEGIYKSIDAMTAKANSRGRIIRESGRYAHPDYAGARTATPLMLAVEASDKELYGQEHFGPISFVIACDDAEHGLARATEDVREHGAITSHVYSSDDGFLERAEDAYHSAGASLSCNLIGMPINFAAAYSDFHVTGLNPAGNACLSDLAFVANRFRIVQTRFPASTAP